MTVRMRILTALHEERKAMGARALADLVGCHVNTARKELRRLATEPVNPIGAPLVATRDPENGWGTVLYTTCGIAHRVDAYLEAQMERSEEEDATPQEAERALWARGRGSRDLKGQCACGIILRASLATWDTFEAHGGLPCPACGSRFKPAAPGRRTERRDDTQETQNTVGDCPF